MISVKGLNKYFFRFKKNEIHVLNDMTIDFPDKGLVVLLGASGSGKTTLLNVIGGLDSVQAGTIQFDQTILEGYDSATWDKIRNESIGYIFQNYNLLPHLSVYDNIALVLKMMGITHDTDIEHRVNYMLNAVNMYPFRKKKSTQLSGGQQQRVAIARALVKNPRVIIADEPTGNLDSKNTIDIMNIIKEISKEKLVILVTHEKDLASIYGDRIIEIKDGQVINDVDNDSTHEHALSDDNVVYLKDLIHPTKLEDQHIAIDLYQDTDTLIEQMSIRLIVKNRTLYLDIDTPVDKVRLLDKSSNLIIKDEHYVKKDKQAMLETTFRTEELSNKNVDRNYKTIVSLKQIFMLALQKIIYSSRKGKLMLFSFILSGAVIAVVVAMAAASIIPDYSSRSFEKDYVIVQDSILNRVSYDSVLGMLDDASESYINTLDSVTVGIVDPTSEDQFFGRITTNHDIIDYVDQRMIMGRKPIAHNEFIITKTMADNFIDGPGAEFGIWSYEHLMIEQFKLNSTDAKLVGIIDSEISVVYTTRQFANLLNPANFLIDNANIQFLGSLAIEDVSLMNGTVPTGDQIIISQAVYNELSSGAPIAGPWPKTLDDVPYPVSGVFLGTDMIAIGSDQILEEVRFNVTQNYYVYTSDPDAFVLAMDDDNTTAYNEMDQIALNFRQAMVEVRVTMSIVALVVIGFALIGFYFIMHSSMVSRIYEIAVYRALGMKKSELRISFLVEVLILSTVTSLVGYLVAAYGLIQANDTLIGMFRLFLVNPISVIVGIIIVYLVNLIGGMIPIMLLLRKTPAQILSQYDI
jgi:ABC-type lipoprotein export system ATPase subunit/ABC-type antimicrobial peptide transport system permease subunit